MIGRSDDSSRGGRLVARNAILLAIFAVVVGAAWVLSQPTPDDLRGRQILAEIRRTGLAAYWPEAAVTWHVRSTGERISGWRGEIVVPTPNGKFHGLSVTVTGTALGTRGLWERWTLNADATESNYLAGGFGWTRRGVRMGKEDTAISLKEGRVTAFQRIQDYPFETVGPAPAGYIPEGAMSIALRLVARHKAKARFRMIFNEVPPPGARPAFTPVEMEFRTPDGDDPEEARMTVHVAPGAPLEEIKNLYFLDASEDTIGLTTPTFVEMQVAAEQVDALFPTAAEQFRKIAERTNMPPPTPAHKPTESDRVECPPRFPRPPGFQRSYFSIGWVILSRSLSAFSNSASSETRSSFSSL